MGNKKTINETLHFKGALPEKVFADEVVKAVAQIHPWDWPKPKHFDCDAHVFKVVELRKENMKNQTCNSLSDPLRVRGR